MPKMGENQNKEGKMKFRVLARSVSRKGTSGGGQELGSASSTWLCAGGGCVQEMDISLPLVAWPVQIQLDSSETKGMMREVIHRIMFRILAE